MFCLRFSDFESSVSCYDAITQKIPWSPNSFSFQEFELVKIKIMGANIATTSSKNKLFFSFFFFSTAIWKCSVQTKRFRHYIVECTNTYKSTSGQRRKLLLKNVFNQNHRRGLRPHEFWNLINPVGTRWQNVFGCYILRNLNASGNRDGTFQCTSGNQLEFSTHPIIDTTLVKILVKIHIVEGLF